MMKRDVTVPVYLITGFLDSGKSNFIKFTLQEEYFNDGSKTLLIVTEEGEEEYSDELLKDTKTDMVVVEDEEELTPVFFEKLYKAHRPDRVLIEYNGMWDVAKMLQARLPKNWQYYQIITICDGENFHLYLNNIKTVAMELLRNTDMVIFNRCKDDSPLAIYQRSVRSVNSKCELVFEGTDGQEIEPPEPDLPYKLEDNPIVITDDNYATFYIDLSEHPDRYKNKNIKFLIQIMQNKQFPKNLFVGGRRAMTCCENDIRFLPYVFIYEKASTIANRSWGNVVATMRWEYNEAYQEEGPVFYISELKLSTRPAEEVVTF